MSSFVIYLLAAIAAIGAYLIVARRLIAKNKAAAANGPQGGGEGDPAQFPLDMAALNAAVPAPPGPSNNLPLTAAELQKKHNYYGPRLYPFIRTGSRTDHEAIDVTNLLMQRSNAELDHYLQNPLDLQALVAGAIVSLNMGNLSI
ncbi:hypothetical protein F4810DRAFT_673033 [Camillea tinctor]|nr:hypothetical protein F4810DRAFT_673033 [Camillea tinctor]